MSIARRTRVFKLSAPKICTLYNMYIVIYVYTTWYLQVRGDDLNKYTIRRITIYAIITNQCVWINLLYLQNIWAQAPAIYKIIYYL